MLGYKTASNDIIVYFESCDLNDYKPKSGKFYFGDTKNFSHLEFIISQRISEMVQSKFEDGELILSVNREVYDRFVQSGRYETHEGFRHVFLLDVKGLDIIERYNYGVLRRIVDNK